MIWQIYIYVRLGLGFPGPISPKKRLESSTLVHPLWKILKSLWLKVAIKTGSYNDIPFLPSISQIQKQPRGTIIPVFPQAFVKNTSVLSVLKINMSIWRA
jgi:hypothetical protein